MEKKISAVDELHMTRAIEKAASLAAADDTKDRNQLLADCLLKNDVDSRFAKTAAMAFNKRLTVLKFQQTPDEKRPETFALSDPDTVFAKMGGVEQQEKTASAHTDYGEFNIGLAKPQMQKIASAKKPYGKPPYEDTVTWDIYQRHLVSVMQKQAAALPHLRHEVEDLGVRLDMAKQAAADALNKLSDFEYSLINAAYGEPLENVLKGRLKERTFRKQARLAKPNNSLTKSLDRLLESEKEYVRKHNDLVDHESGLCEFCYAATELGNDMAKTAGIMDYRGYVGPLMGWGLRGTTALGMAAPQIAYASGRALMNTADAGFANAAAMRNAVDNGMSPGKVLDSQFLIKDRYRDRMMGWSDMTADPLFSMYPSEQVFMATQKAMDLDPALERSDKREMLRTMVGKLLAQNNRLSDADIAAAANTLHSLQGADLNQAQEAAAPVMAMDKVKAPERPETRSLLSIINENSPELSTTDYIGEASKLNDKEFADAAKEVSDKRLARKTEEAGNKQQQELVRKEFATWSKNMGVRMVYDQNRRQYRFTMGGQGNYSMNDILKLYQNYRDTMPDLLKARA